MTAACTAAPARIRWPAATALAPVAGQLQVITGLDAAPAQDVGIGPALLRQVVSRGQGGWLRVYRPAPTVAFSRRDTLSPGFSRAVQLSLEHAFTPVLRAPGGRAAGYHEQALCLDLVVADDDPRAATTGRFLDLADLLVEALTSLGVDARVGPVPHEYCPGRYSVNGEGRIKLAGTAQRVVRGGWYLGAVLLVDGADPVREVIAAVYAALGMHCDITSVGAVSDVAGGIDVADVQTAVLAAFAHRVDMHTVDHPGGLPADLMAHARRAALEHPDLPDYPYPPPAPA